ncbi:flagellar biosynthesis protein FlhB [Caulobacter sp. 17J80-11]|uniref:flagellar biosynthesis protein FlhB n=1 Tax=Caulobacter sp. 17J80-11 TaxID=2763502 RepID=UPI0016538A7B|nr:flagellar biosynthesis protein FlhB [Caulobacter sp. 17J80-11]
MAEEHDPSSKTEEASPRKLEEARKKGDVAKSPDVASWLSLAAVCGVLAVSGGAFAGKMAEAFLPFVAAPHQLVPALESGAGGDLVRQALWGAAPLLGAVLAAAAIGGAGGNLIQHGFLFTPDKLKPDLNKVSPMAGFKRIFGADGLVNFLKTVLKLAAVCWVCWLVMKPHAGELQNMAAMSPLALLPFARELMLALGGAVLALLGFVAGGDFLWQRIRFLQRMRMSREETKEEYKQTEGDPHVKAKLKQLRAEKARKRMMANVPKATVVITNPTHYAVALRYVNGEDAAPVCLAKGVDAIALKIREIAGEHEIPIVEDPPLARALYATVDVDGIIPREHFEAVAKVIGFVMNKGRGAARSQRATPR